MTEARVAIVTGAGSGIGRAVASAFIAGGYRVILAGRRADALLHTIRSADGNKDNASHTVTDVCDRQSVANLFSACRAKFGRLNVLFSNAGITNPPTPLEDLEFDAWERVLNTNVTGMFLCLQNAFSIMKSQVPRGGRIISNGSIAAVSPRPGSIAD
jgi:NAD(P)-dependent dehydrogenase (short-subunit alcohol dehydrogenase family)